MASYGIDNFNFEFWDGPPPPVPTQKVVTAHRPGVSGVSHQLLGTWGDTFAVTLTSHWANQLAAIQGHALMVPLIGSGGKYVKYNDINWTGMYGVLYNVDAIDILDLRSSLCLIGPTYYFPNGASLVTRWTLTPQKV